MKVNEDFEGGKLFSFTWGRVESRALGEIDS